MILRIFIIATFVVKFGAAQLVVTPAGDAALEIGESKVYICTNQDSNGDQPRWSDAFGNPIQTIATGGSDQVYSVEDSQTKTTYLHLVDVELIHTGLYACEVDGYLSQTRQVIVEGRIEFIKKSEEEDQRILFNQTGTIYCTARQVININPIRYSTDGLRMTWQFNRGTTSNPDKYSAVFGALTVRNVVTADTGTYACTVISSQTGKTEFLNINGVAQVPPIWEVAPRDTSAVQGGNITIQCRARGEPEPTYQWTDLDGNLITDVPGKYRLTGNGEFLNIYNLRLPDDGSRVYIFQCNASNDAVNSPYRTSIQRSMRLTVLIPPILNAQENETKNERESVVMECANTNPNSAATLTWRRGGLRDEDIVNPQDDSRVTITENSQTGAKTLTITNLQRSHEGPWTCYAESDAGDVYVDHFLFVNYAPLIDRSRTPARTVSWEGNPTNLTCSFFGYPVPTIRWYKNQWRLNETDNIDFLQNTEPGTSTVVMIPRLEDFGAYFCEARSSSGVLRYRQELVKARRPSAPQGLAIREVTSSTVRLEFQPPEDHGELELIGYDVSFWIRGDVRETVQEFDNITDVILTRLSAQSLYVIRVAAKNEMGRGDYTENRTVNTDDYSKPDPPEIRSYPISDKGTEYILVWEPPLNDGGEDIEEYVIQYAQVDGPDAQELGPRPAERTVNGDQRRFKLTGLNEGRFYRIHLSATNRIGTSDYIHIIVRTAGRFTFATTPKTRPQARIELFETKYIVAIVVAGFLVLLILLDVCCFCVNDCGLLMFICVTCCGKTPPSAKQEIEIGDDEFGLDSLKDWDSFNGKLEK